MKTPVFQEPQSYTILIDGGLDLTSAQIAKKPGSFIAGSNVEMIGNQQGASRVGGYERCVDDILPSETRVAFLSITDLDGNIAVDDVFLNEDSARITSLDTVAVFPPCYAPANNRFKNLGAGGADVFSGWTEAVALDSLIEQETVDVPEGIDYACKQTSGTTGIGPIIGTSAAGIPIVAGSRPQLIMQAKAQNSAVTFGIIVRISGSGKTPYYLTETGHQWLSSVKTYYLPVADVPEEWGQVTVQLPIIPTGYTLLDQLYVRMSGGTDIQQTLLFTEICVGVPVELFINDTATVATKHQGTGVVAVSTHDTDFEAGSVFTKGAVNLTFVEEVIDTSDYTTDQIRDYTQAAIEQTRDAVLEIPGTEDPAGGFRLWGENYVFRDGHLYRGDSYAWTEITMPQVMYFYEGLSEFKVGDQITDGTAVATIASITQQAGAWNYSYELVDQAAGYFTLSGVTGTFTADANLTVVGDTVPAIVNGAFAADTDWTKGTGWTIAAGKATCSGAQTADSDLSQAFVIDTGRSVEVTFTLSSVSAGKLTLFLGDFESIEYTADGTYTTVITYNIGDALIGFRADADFTGSIDDVTATAGRRASVKSANIQYVLPEWGSYQHRVYNFTNLDDHNSVYGVSGDGEAFEFDGENYIPIFFPDFPTTFPFLIDIHQERLCLGFPGGQFVLSVSGQPRVFNALLGSTTYSTGAELVGSRKIHGNALSIFTQSSIWLLLGTGIMDEATQIRAWQFVEHDSSIGALIGSMTDKGPAMFVSGTEYRTLYPTQDTAGYKSSPIFEQLQPLLADGADKIAGSLWCRKKSQHRLFLNDGTAIYTTFAASKPKGGLLESFPIPILHAWSTIEDSTERIWFLSNTGYLYQMDSGNSFDDEEISGSFRLPFYSYGNNRRLKSFPQMTIGFTLPVNLAGDTEITYAVNHNYGDPNYPRPTIESVSNPAGAGGFYGSNAGFGKFIWGGRVVSEILAYLDGYGPNMSILVTFKTRYDNPFMFQTVVVDFIQLGLVGSE